jgi:hypothetical protein
MSVGKKFAERSPVSDFESTNFNFFEICIPKY